MNKTNLKKWITALRSGEYKQTIGYLCKKQEDESFAYCCLGVVCELAGVEKKPSSRITLGPAYAFLSLNNIEATALLPDAGQKWLGLDFNEVYAANVIILEPPLPFLDDYSILLAATANDDVNLNFNQIADCLEWEYYQVLNSGE